MAGLLNFYCQCDAVLYAPTQRHGGSKTSLLLPTVTLQAVVCLATTVPCLTTLTSGANSSLYGRDTTAGAAAAAQRGEGSQPEYHEDQHLILPYPPKPYEPNPKPRRVSLSYQKLSNAHRI